jgi:hypothetical protein
MILTLETHDLIERTPGQARSIRLLIPRDELPDSSMYGNKKCSYSVANWCTPPTTPPDTGQVLSPAAYTRVILKDPVPTGLI